MNEKERDELAQRLFSLGESLKVNLAHKLIQQVVRFEGHGEPEQQILATTGALAMFIFLSKPRELDNLTPNLKELYTNFQDDKIYPFVHGLELYSQIKGVTPDPNLSSEEAQRVQNFLDNDFEKSQQEMANLNAELRKSLDLTSSLQETMHIAGPDLYQKMAGLIADELPEGEL